MCWSSLEDEAKALFKVKQFLGKSGEVFPLSSGNQLVILVGLGKEEDVNPAGLRTAVRQALLSSYAKEPKSFEIISLQKNQDDQSIIATIEGILIGTYKWTKYKNRKEI